MENDSELRTSREASRDMRDELRRSLETMLFWLEQGDFSKMPVGAIQNMVKDKIDAREIIAKNMRARE